MTDDLSEFFRELAKEKKQKKEEFNELVGDLNLDSIFSEVSSLKKESKKKKVEEKKAIKAFEEFLFSEEESVEKEEKAEEAIREWIEDPVEEIVEEPEVESEPEEDLIEKSLGLLAEPEPEQQFATLDDLSKHYKIFIDRIQQQLSTLGGGGEVRLEFLDDVDRDSAKVNGRFLKYNSSTGKWIGANVSGGGGGDSEYASSAGIATEAVSAGIATYASTSGVSTYATSSGIATEAVRAGLATEAVSAGIATYAATAGIATYATSSGIATEAVRAGLATEAVSAGIATYATSSGVSTYATSAGIATEAVRAGLATEAISAGIATYAATAGIATYATTAGIATEAVRAGLATEAVSAGIATFATIAGIASNAYWVQNASGIHTTSNVGLGLTNPSVLLHMFGSYPTLKIQNSATAQYASASIDLQGPAGDERYTKILHGNSNAGGTETYFQIEQYNPSGSYVKKIAQYDYQYDYWDFLPAGTRRLRVDTSGIDVTGHTELDNVNVSGVSTFQSHVHLGDDDELRFGAANDFKIVHDPNDCRFENSNGDIKFKNTGSYYFFDEDGGETLASFINDGAVNLFHNGTRRIETTGYGATVFGTTQTQQLNVSGVSTFVSYVGIGSTNPEGYFSVGAPDSNGVVATFGSYGGGRLGITQNDGGGNINLTFNHADEKADRDGSSGRISCGVDGNDAAMEFELHDSVTQGTSYDGAAMTQVLQLRTGDVRFLGASHELNSVGLGIHCDPGNSLDIQTQDCNIRMFNTTGATVSSDTDGWIINAVAGNAADNANGLNLRYNGSTKVEFDTSGNITVPGINLGNETLDEYDEGTFTPTYNTTNSDIGSVTYDNQVGRYVRIGKICYFSLRLRTDSISSVGTGNVEIRGFPFNHVNNTAARASMIVYSTGWTATDAPTLGLFLHNSDILRLYQKDYNEDSANLASSSLNTGANDNDIRISGVYEVQG